MANQLSTQQVKRDITTDPTLLTGADIKKYFDPQNLLSEKQVGQALALCKGRNLNPFANEVYIVAYKNNSGTDFSLIVSKEAFMKRAERCEGYDGFEAGITVMRNGEMVEIEGSLKLPDDVLIGGWAIVYRKDRSHRYKVTVDFNEYVKLDKYGNPRSTWKSMPGTMIRKTALVQTLREAFPDELGNMYTDIDGGDTFDAIKDVTPQETQEEVRARKMTQIEQYKQEQAQKQTQKADTSYPVDEVSEHTDDPVQGELLDGELEY
ncbi:phage recombination protein Bet [Streptococcus pyogenes]|uniref:Phage protein RecT family n=1 Tax=Streptococcus pyogenes TaxID=1314 RepID=A0A8B6J663_STRPY|nr:phage recombination protein Bet [Streptococcus pyogenes]TYK78768.1 phage recombination protein Bet [Streptococcus pyogenes]WSE72493.1 phage recombination protein Bet [Streptococcus pyogenes]VGQ25484.1 phage protein RecT family [Streptococcus pyogenes]VGQ27096.1 phage protein RecT family [Streptococcus pyogenes]VGQ55344.1 phage protein RecT family [Streptococcus pyogenes]